MKGKAKGKAKAAVAAVAAKEKEEEKVEAWMVSLAVVDEPEESFEEVMDTPESQFHLDENFGEEFIIPDNYSSLPNNSNTRSEAFDGLDSLSEEIEYVSIKEEAYVTTYKSTVLRGTPGVCPTDIDLYVKRTTAAVA